MSGRRTLSAPILAGVAGVGLMLGHFLTYVVVQPGRHARDVLLSQTGHGYLSTASQAAALLAIAAAASVMVRVARARANGEDLDVHGRWALRIPAQLALLQCGAFVLMEIAERLATGSSVSGVLADHLLLIGLGLQLVLAAMGGILLRWLTRAGEWIGVHVLARLPRPHQRSVSWPAPPEASPRSQAALVGVLRVRAPPRSRVAV
jgi:hypothetical protein